MDQPAVLTRRRATVQDELRGVLGDRALPIYDMVRYALGWIEVDGAPRRGEAGKGIRPALTLLTAEAFGSTEAAAPPAVSGAAAVELIHNFSLVHDDIQDGDRERHHRPTVWAQWGEAQAINVGDALRELAQIALGRASDAGAAPGTVLAASETLNRCALDMIEGQYLDLDYETRPRVTVDDYLTMIERKTGAMLGCSLALGALFATEDRGLPARRDQAARLERAGRCLGLAFQIRDDILGIWGDSTATGKSSSNDIRRRKKSFPIVYAMTEGGDAHCPAIERVYNPARIDAEIGDDDVAAIIGELEALGARSAGEAAADRHYQGFLEALDGCGLSDTGRADLDEAGRFIIQRTF